MKGSAEDMNKKNYDPIIGIFPDQDKIKCTNCKYRLKKIVLGKDLGPSNAYCSVYTKETNGKPISVLFKSACCDYYEAD